MIQITAAQLKAIAPECQHPELWAPPIQSAMMKYGVAENKYRVQAFLAHVCVESAGFNRVRENLFYSSAERIAQVWPARFPDIRIANQYVRNPTLLANFVYANRLGNGGEQSGDGYRYRGGGLIQTTGKGNYAALSRELGLPLIEKPELIEEKPVAALSAAYFWYSHKLNELADAIPGVSEDEDFLKETKIINGGVTGLADRRNRFTIAQQTIQ